MLEDMATPNKEIEVPFIKLQNVSLNLDLITQVICKQLKMAFDYVETSCNLIQSVAKGNGQVATCIRPGDQRS